MRLSRTRTYLGSPRDTIVPFSPTNDLWRPMEALRRIKVRRDKVVPLLRKTGNGEKLRRCADRAAGSSVSLSAQLERFEAFLPMGPLAAQSSRDSDIEIGQYAVEEQVPKCTLDPRDRTMQWHHARLPDFAPCAALGPTVHLSLTARRLALNGSGASPWP